MQDLLFKSTQKRQLKLNCLKPWRNFALWKAEKKATITDVEELTKVSVHLVRYTILLNCLSLIVHLMLNEFTLIGCFNRPPFKSL